MPKLTCPACGETITGYTELSAFGLEPHPGAVVICAKCTAPLELSSRHTLVRLDIEALDTARLIEVRAAVQVVLRMKAAKLAILN